MDVTPRGTDGYDGGYRASGLTPEDVAWGVPAPVRSYWPARLAILAAIGLYLLLPERLIPGNRYIIPSLEAVVLAALSIFTPHRTTQQSKVRRTVATLLIATVTVANLINLGLLVRLLLRGGVGNGRELIFSSIAIWLTNVIVFGSARESARRRWESGSALRQWGACRRGDAAARRRCCRRR